jgi:hypothetical protein
MPSKKLKHAALSFYDAYTRYCIRTDCDKCRFNADGAFSMCDEASIIKYYSTRQDENE